MKMLNWIMGVFLAIFLSITFMDVKIRPQQITRQANHQVIDLKRGVNFTVLGESAQAQEAQSAPAAEAEVAQPSYLDKLMAMLAGAGGLVGGLVIVFEMLMRAFPSKKPLSLLIPARYFCNAMSVILKFVADVMDKLINVAQNAPKPPLK